MPASGWPSSRGQARSGSKLALLLEVQLHAGCAERPAAPGAGCALHALMPPSRPIHNPERVTNLAGGCAAPPLCSPVPRKRMAPPLNVDQHEPCRWAPLSLLQQPSFAPPGAAFCCNACPTYVMANHTISACFQPVSFNSLLLILLLVSLHACVLCAPQRPSSR